MGYEFNYTNGMPGYNGVCILSKNKATEVKCINWCSKNDSRHIQIKVNGINVHSLYVPAGGDEPDQKRNPKFKHKIDFLDELTLWIKKNKHTKTIICGDFNVAMFKDDVWSHKNLCNVVSHTEIERKKLYNFLKSGNFIDVIRKFNNPPNNIFTWWSYRSPNFKVNNRGRRLDYIWTTKDLFEKTSNAQILSYTREWKKPSDHVPLIIDLKI